jgi:phage shock protein C
MSAPAGRPLRRSRRHRILGGVCGGVANWLGWNPTLVRIAYVAVSVCSAAFPGVLVYLVLWLLMPLEDHPSSAA